MAEDDPASISLKQERADPSAADETVSGREKAAAEEGMLIYEIAQRRRRRAWIALGVVALLVLAGCFSWLVENTRAFVYILFAVPVSFGSAAIFMMRGMRKMQEREAAEAGRPPVPMVLAAVVTVLVVLGIPALVIWLYTKIGVPLP